ncbi:hypothetical protein EMCRGX_G006617 [Ephydatia muelleri]
MDWVKELSNLTTTSHVRTISLRIGEKVFISQGFITGLPTAQMFNDSVSSTYSSFGVDSLAENLYASTPPSSPSLSEYSFVGNVSPITPEVSCVSSDESDDHLNPMSIPLNQHLFQQDLSTDPIEIVQDSINFEMFYPTVGDNTQLVSNLETLVARMFVQRIPGLQSLSAEATPHIKHQYSKQMALKSEVGLEFGHNIASFLLIDAQVIWKRLYSSCSGMDTGTLFQLRNVINRRNVITDISKDLTACEEFMQLATIAHVMSAAIHIAGVTNISELFPKIMSTDKPIAAVKSLVKTLISEMVRIEYIAGTSESTCPSIDSVQDEGGPGHNIPADLHMEHLNKLLKGTICHLGANKTPQAIIRAEKALGALKYILEEFDKSTGVWVTTNHTTRSEAEDLMKMVTECSQNKVFSHKPGRNHQIFPSIQCNKLLESINQKKLDLYDSEGWRNP